MDTLINVTIFERCVFASKLFPENNERLEFDLNSHDFMILHREMVITTSIAVS